MSNFFYGVVFFVCLSIPAFMAPIEAEENWQPPKKLMVEEAK